MADPKDMAERSACERDAVLGGTGFLAVTADGVKRIAPELVNLSTPSHDGGMVDHKLYVGGLGLGGGKPWIAVDELAQSINSTLDEVWKQRLASYKGLSLPMRFDRERYDVNHQAQAQAFEAANNWPKPSSWKTRLRRLHRMAVCAPPGIGIGIIWTGIGLVNGAGLSVSLFMGAVTAAAVFWLGMQVTTPRKERGEC